MLNVLITIDTELWPSRWDLSPEAARKAFDSYILGLTRLGEFGVNYQLDRIRELGLRAVCFVEPLFARELGTAMLGDIVGMILDRGQDVELHLHGEWNFKGKNPLIPNSAGRNLSSFQLGEQIRLIEEGIRLLEGAGANRPWAFRAGGYKANLDTLRALRYCGIRFDSSYNISEPGSGTPEFMAPDNSEPRLLEGTWEIPVTVFDDRVHGLRHAQIGACSFGELSAMLKQAWRDGASCFVIVSHGSELLTRDKSAPDGVVVRRFQRLLRFLAKHADRYRTIGFHDLELGDHLPDHRLKRFQSNPFRTGYRMLEQGSRRFLVSRTPLPHA